MDATPTAGTILINVCQIIELNKINRHNFFSFVGKIFWVSRATRNLSTVPLGTYGTPRSIVAQYVKIIHTGSTPIL